MREKGDLRREEAQRDREKMWWVLSTFFSCGGGGGGVGEGDFRYNKKSKKW